MIRGVVLEGALVSLGGPMAARGVFSEVSGVDWWLWVCYGWSGCVGSVGVLWGCLGVIRGVVWEGALVSLGGPVAACAVELRRVVWCAWVVWGCSGSVWG